MSIFASAPVQRNAGDYIDVTRWNAEIYTKLNEINALFNYTTGHDHSAADKGKQIALANISGHTKAVHDALALDHGVLSGRADDDHTQYYNAARHTKAVHDALNIDADTVDGAHYGTTSGYLKKIYVQSSAPGGSTAYIWIDT